MQQISSAYRYTTFKIFYRREQPLKYIRKPYMCGSRLWLTELGKKTRMRRIFEPITNTSLIIPMDHPVEGYFPELEDPRKIIEELANAGVNAFLLRRGLAKFTSLQYIGRAALILRITSATSLRNKVTEQVFVSSVEEALRLGADAVAATIFVGSEREIEDLRYFGIIADECDKWSVPLLGEMIPIGGKDSTPYDGPYTAEDVRQAVRVGCEEGADFIKTHYTGDIESFRKVIKYSTVPVVIAGGPKVENITDILKMAKDGMEAGAAGFAMGRKIWTYKDPPALTRALLKIIRDKVGVEEAEKVLKIESRTSK